MNSPAKLTETQLIVLSAASQRDDRRVIMPDRLRGGAADKLLKSLTSRCLIAPIAKRKQGSRPQGADVGGLTNYRISAAGLARIGVSEAGPIPPVVSELQNGSGSRARRTCDIRSSAAKSAGDNCSGADREYMSDHQPAPESDSASSTSDVAGNRPLDMAEPRHSNISAPKEPAHGSNNDAANDSCRPPRAGSKLDQVIAILSSEKGATIDSLINATGWLPHTARAALTGLRHRGYDVRLERGGKEQISVYRIASAPAIAS